VKRAVLILCLVALAACTLMAQRRWGWRAFGDGLRTAREVPSDSTGTPAWTNAPGFERDVFTFARIRYARGGYGRGDGLGGPCG